MLLLVLVLKVVEREEDGRSWGWLLAGVGRRRWSPERRWWLGWGVAKWRRRRREGKRRKGRKKNKEKEKEKKK